jgi:hypothetical protein
MHEEYYKDRVEALEAQLRKLLDLVDQCKTMELGSGGMSLDSQASRTVYLRVPMLPFENARAVLEKHDE